MICDMFTDIFFFNDTAPTEIYTLPLHDALPISCPATDAARPPRPPPPAGRGLAEASASDPTGALREKPETGVEALLAGDRKSTRLNSSHANISYAVFCLKKKKNKIISHESN